MATYAQEKAAAEKTGTRESEKSRLMFKRGIFGASLIVALFLATHSWKEHNAEKQVARAKNPPASAPTVVVLKECTKENSCLPVMQGASTKAVPIKGGKSVCFDRSFRQNLSRLGYRTSFDGGKEMSPGCTAGSCNSDTFRFFPESGVPLPRYWFVNYGSPEC